METVKNIILIVGVITSCFLVAIALAFLNKELGISRNIRKFYFRYIVHNYQIWIGVYFMSKDSLQETIAGFEEAFERVPSYRKDRNLIRFYNAMTRRYMKLKYK